MPVVTFIDLSKVKVEAYITESMATSFQNKEHKGIDVGEFLLLNISNIRK